MEPLSMQLLLVNLEYKIIVMSSSELKIKLIERIAGSKNDDLLIEVSRLLDMGNDADNIYPLNPEQVAVIKEGQQQYKAGKTISEEETEKDIDEWLGK